MNRITSIELHKTSIGQRTLAAGYTFFDESFEYESNEFILSKAPIPGSVTVFVNGMRLSNNEYVLNQNILTVDNNELEVGDHLAVQYAYLGV